MPHQPNDCRGKTSIRIKIRVEDRNRHPPTPVIGNERSQDLHQIIRSDTWRPRAIDCWHDSPVQHINIKVYPEALLRHPIERFTDTFDNNRRADHQRFKNIYSVDGSVVYVRPCKIFVPAFTFADLDNMVIGHQRTGYTGPFGRQGLTSTRRERKVHACHSTQTFFGVIIARMAKVAMPINMNKRKWTCGACTCKCSQENRAVPSDDQCEVTLPIGFAY